MIDSLRSFEHRHQLELAPLAQQSDQQPDRQILLRKPGGGAILSSHLAMPHQVRRDDLVSLSFSAISSAKSAREQLLESFQALPENHREK